MVNYFITFPIVRKTPFFRFGSTKIEHAISVYGGSESFVEVCGGKKSFSEDKRWEMRVDGAKQCEKGKGSPKAHLKH